MKITFNDIDLAFSGSTSPITLLENLKISDPLISYRLGKSIRALREAGKEITEKRNELITEFGRTINDKGELVSPFIPPHDVNARNAFSDAMEEFLSLEVLDLKVYPVKVSDLGVRNMEPAIFAYLWFLFEENEE